MTGRAIPNRAADQRDLEDAETLRQLGRDIPGLGSAIPNRVRRVDEAWRAVDWDALPVEERATIQAALMEYSRNA